MIAPHKYLNLDISVISLGGLILNILKEEEVIKYEDLLEKIVLSRGLSAKDVFLQTLSFLYLMGKIEYKTDIDTIEYII